MVNEMFQVKINRMWITQLLFALFSAMDISENFANLSFLEARQIAQEKRIVQYLRQQLPDLINWQPLFNEYQEVVDEINNAISEISHGQHGREAKKFLIQNHGYALLGAYLTELAQQVIMSFADP